MSDFKSRLHTEKEELGEKIEKLESFISGDQFKNIDSVQQILLELQLDSMKHYYNILSKRIDLL